MRKETDIIHVINWQYLSGYELLLPDKQGDDEDNRKKHHAYLHEEAIVPDEHPKILSDAVGPSGQ